MFTDMHNHFIYGVDDGCADQEAMFKLLRKLDENRITKLIATSHAIPGQQHFPMDEYLAHFGEAREFISHEGLHMQIYPGQEILYTDATARYLREKKALTLAGSEYVLIEFLPGEKYERLCEAAQKIGNAGFFPIFAHVERYICLTDIKKAEELHDRYGVRMQVNCSLFVRKQGLLRKHWIKNMMRSDLIDYVSTDTHDMPGREPVMAQCYETLVRDYGEDTAHALTRENADIFFV